MSCNCQATNGLSPYFWFFYYFYRLLSKRGIFFLFVFVFLCNLNASAKNTDDREAYK